MNTRTLYSPSGTVGVEPGCLSVCTLRGNKLIFRMHVYSDESIYSWTHEPSHCLRPWMVLNALLFSCSHASERRSHTQIVTATTRMRGSTQVWNPSSRASLKSLKVLIGRTFAESKVSCWIYTPICRPCIYLCLHGCRNLHSLAILF